MSYDLAVWVGNEPVDDETALANFNDLFDRYEDADEPPDPMLLAFLDELTARYPDLDDLEEDRLDESPWATSPLRECVMGPLLYLNMRWDAVDEAVPVIARMAARHRLVCFDPQSDMVVSVDRLAS